MARSKSGGFFNKALEFIGLVDEEPQEYPEDNAKDYSRREPPRSAPRSDRQGPRRSYTRPNETESRSYGSRRNDYGPRGEQPGDRRYRDGAGRPGAEEPRRDRTERPQGSFRSGAQPGGRGYSSRYSYDNVRREQEARSRRQAPPPRRDGAAPSGGERRRSRTVMYSMHDFADCREVIKHLIAGNTVVLTLEEVNSDMSQRVLDTLSGAVFALKASIRRASDSTYLLAPSTVDVNEAYETEDEGEF